MIKKRAQIWGFDVMIASALFIVTIVIFFTFSLNQSDETTESFDLLFYDGNVMANNLMSEGFPKNWDSSTVSIIGLTTNNRINQSKLDELYKMIYEDNNYTKTKNLFNTKYDYYFFFEENMTANSTSIEGIGYPSATKTNIISKNLVKITRFTIYENKTLPLYIYIWE